MSNNEAPPGYPVPVKLGETIVGWAAEAVTSHLGRSPVPHLLIVPMPPEVLALRAHKRFVLIRQTAISYLSSLGGVVTAYTDSGRFWTDQPLSRVEQRLDPRRFFRLDQSHVVNLARIAELVPWTHQRYRLVFADQAKSELAMSRDVGRRLRAALGW